ncbi:MAG: hypothetical protein ACHQO8_01880 [Vicinamibacterales bacterium]
MSRRAVAAILAAAVVVAAACGSSSDRGVPAPRRGSAPASSPAAAAAGLVGHRRLEAFVPAVAGWKAGRVAGADVSLPAPASHVRATFTKDAVVVDLELTDSGGEASYVQALASIAGTPFHEEAPNGYMKGTTVAGFPAVESFNRDDNLAEITILINRRFIVHASGTGGGVESVQDVVSHIDLGGISALK